MANPFYQQYSQNIENVNSQQNITHMKDIYNAMVNSKDPMQMFINMAKNNPNMTPQAKRGDVIEVVNNSIQLRRPGYYNIDITITFTAADAGDVSLAIYKNNVKVPGLTAVETITTANTEYRTVNIQGVVRVLCHEYDV